MAPTLTATHLLRASQPEMGEIDSLFSSATSDGSDSVDLRDVMAILKATSNRYKKSRAISMSKVEWLLSADERKSGVAP